MSEPPLSTSLYRSMFTTVTIAREQHLSAELLVAVLLSAWHETEKDEARQAEHTNPLH